MNAFPPPPPDTLPEIPDIPRRSRYRRPRRYVSWTGLILGIILGVTGGLGFAWSSSPVEEFDTAPWQLKQEDKEKYVVAIILQWSYDGDLGSAINRLLDLKLKGDDPIQQVADIACKLASSDYVNNNSGMRAIRTMIQFYELQGRTGCAEVLLPAYTPQAQITIVPPTATPTVPPPPSKTPTPQDAVRPSTTPFIVIVPTTPPQLDFRIVRLEPFCDVELAGVIEVRVQQPNADPIPGQAVRVRWDGGQDTFLTGMKPERGMDYADYAMETGKGYTVEIPGRSNPSQPMNAVSCTTENGQESIQSYRVFFRPSG
jgi:hypothetical protein